MKFPVLIPRYFILSLLFSIFYFLFSAALAPSAFAQNQSLPQNPYTAPNNNPDVPKNLHTYSQNVLIEVIAAMNCQLIGIDPLNPNQKCLGFDQKTGQIGFVEGGGGAIGVMGKMIASLYTPPIHTNEYVRYLSQNFGLVKTAHAQGLGFQGMSPLIKLWSTFRNVVFLIFVLIFILIGLAIMLRIKIDPRTVMSIENQLPKIIIALLLVTFSFAIAGLLIDVMYIVIYLIFNLFNDPNVMCKASQTSCASLTKIVNTQQNFNGQNTFGVFNELISFQDTVTYSAGGVKDIVRNLFSVPELATNTKPEWWRFWDWGDYVKNGFGFLFGGIAGVLALLIFAIALLWALFRLWFELIKAYIFLLIDVVFAPFFIVTGVFPGGLGFGGWLRDILSNLSPFPTTIAMFLLGRAFMVQFEGQNQQPLFVPPLIGNPNDSQAIMSLIGFGIILITPQVVVMMKDLFKAPQFKYTAAIGQAVGVGAGAQGKLVGGLGSLALGVQYEEEKGGLVGKGGTMGKFARAFGFVK